MCIYTHSNNMYYNDTSNSNIIILDMQVRKGESSTFYSSGLYRRRMLSAAHGRSYIYIYMHINQHNNTLFNTYLQTIQYTNRISSVCSAAHLTRKTESWRMPSGISCFLVYVYVCCIVVFFVCWLFYMPSGNLSAARGCAWPTCVKTLLLLYIYIYIYVYKE